MTTRLSAGADAESRSLVLIGGPEAFRQLAQLLRAGRAAAVEVEGARGRAAIRPIAAFRLERGLGGVTIALSGDTAILAGDAASNTRLAEEIDLFLEHNDLNQPGMHMHIDTSSGGPGALLAPESHGLVLAGPVPDNE
jgi:hypothetical protein